MFNAFMSDKSGFKNIIVLLILLSFVVLGGAFMMLGRYNAIVAANDKSSANFKSQAAWLQKYDGSAVTEIEKAVLHPCKENEVDRVQKEQLQLLSSKGLTVTSVKKATIAKTKDNKSTLKGVKTSVTFEGSWENIVAALNEFEKQKSLVVITDLSLNSKDVISGRLDYVVYYTGKGESK